MAKINFFDIQDPEIAIHFDSQKELNELVDYLKKYDYDYGTGKQIEGFNDVYSIKELGVRYFGGKDDQYITLDRRKKHHPRNYCSCGKGKYAVEYEFSDIEWSQVKEKGSALCDGMWNVCLSHFNEENKIVTENNPAKTGRYLCTCVQEYPSLKESYKYLNVMEYDADKNYWHDCGYEHRISHNILAWTDKVKPCEFSDYEYIFGGLFMETQEDVASESENLEEDIER